ncbi:MAG: type 2 lantipeptide synthetase LanM [Firmicutes bacterium]|nr:type 2 lantipeptide synthetase LanM [Bacillota bacterium]
MLNKNFIYALKINERIDAFKEANFELKTDTCFLDRWTNIKGLTNINDTKLKLEFEGISLDEFIYGIKPFDDFEREVLSEYLKDQDWYNELILILEEYKTNGMEKIEIKDNFAHVISPFIYEFSLFLKEEVKKLKNIKVEKNASIRIIDYIARNLSLYAIRVVTLELHNYKNSNPGYEESFDDKSEAFQKFLEDQYGAFDGLIDLYNSYPTMTRLVVTRLDNFKKHFSNALHRLDSDFIEIKSMFGLTNNKLTDVDCGQGDSHQGGQAVLTFVFENNEKVVYKPKNLKIEERFYSLLNWINLDKNSKLGEFKYISSLYREDYTISKYINYSEADSEKDIAKYYNKVGQYLMLLYILGGNDIHFENIIASKDTPYIIDLETLFQNTDGIYQEIDLAETQTNRNVANSVLSIGILPLIGLNQNEEGTGVDISALNGTKQKLPFKVLKPKNVNTSDMIFEYDYAELSDAKNIPLLNGERIPFYNYVDDIINGFNIMGEFILENKADFLQKLDELFGQDEVIVRLLIKATANYGALSNFINHPNYLNDMVYLEKLLDNLMSFPYRDKKIILREIEAMSQNDIPVFFRPVNNLDLIYDNGEREKDILTSNPLDIIRNKISSLDNDAIEKQINYIKITLSQYHKDNVIRINEINKSVNQVDPIDNYNSYIDSINKILIDKIQYNKDMSDLTWEIIDKKTSTITVMDLSLYDGLAGLGVYFYNLYNIFKEDSYRKIYEKIKNKIFTIPNKMLLKRKELLTAHYFFTLAYKENNDEEILGKIKSINHLYSKVVNEINLGKYKVDENIGELLLLSKCLFNTFIVTKEQEYLQKSNIVLQLVESSNVELDIYSHMMAHSIKKSFQGSDYNIKGKLKSYLDEILSTDSLELWKSKSYDSYFTGINSDINNLLTLNKDLNNNTYFTKAKELIDLTLTSYNKNNQYRIFNGLGYYSLGLNEGLVGIAYTILRMLYPAKVNDAFLMNIES